MEFEFDETQQAIAQVAAGVLDDTGPDLPERAWKALGQSGMLSLAIPAWMGGDGLGVVEIAVLLAEVGRRAVPMPALATLAMGVLPVARWGSLEAQRELLSGVATGAAVLTAALREPSAPMPAAPGTTMDPAWRVSGVKVGVPYAAQAHRVLVPVSLTGGGTAVAIVDPSGPGVAATRTPSSSGMPEYTLRLAEAPAAGILGGARAHDLYPYAIAGACAIGDGLLAGALALTASHIGTRHQFGRPLAAFQAVAQQIADVYVASRTLHVSALAACSGFALADLDVAAYWLAQETPAALRTCHHLHGGLGLDVSYPLHRYSAQVKDLVRLIGGPGDCLERLCSST